MATYYFDVNGNADGFGTTGGTYLWTGSYWTQSNTGTTATGTLPAGVHDIYFSSTVRSTGVAKTIQLPSSTVTINSLSLPYSGGSDTVLTYSGSATLDFGATKVPILANSLLYLSPPLAGTNGFNFSGSSLLIIDTQSTTNSISGNITITGNGNGLFIVRPNTANTTFFGSISQIQFPGAAGETPPAFLIQPVSVGAVGTIPASFVGANVGIVRLQGDVSAGGASITGSVAGMAGYDSTNVEKYGVGLYAKGTLKLIDLPRQLSFFSDNGDSSTCEVSVASGTPTYPTTVHLSHRNNVGVPVWTLSSLGASSFTIGGGLKRTTGNSTNAVTFILRGTNTGENTLAGGTTTTVGTVALQKLDAGKWVLADNNAALSSVLIGNGTVKATNSNSFGGNVTMNAGAVLELSGGINIGNAINVINSVRSLSGANTLSGTLTLGGSTTFQVDADSLNITSTATLGTSGANLTFTTSGPISFAPTISTGSGTLTKNGTAALTLSAYSSTFSGAVAINGGTVITSVLASAGVASSIGQGSAVSFASDGTLRHTSIATVLFDRTISGTVNNGGFENNAGGALVVTTGTLTGTIKLGGTGRNQFNKYSAGLGATSGFNKSGAGRWVVEGSNNLSGDTSITNTGALSNADISTLMANDTTGAYADRKLLGGRVTVGANARLHVGTGPSDRKGRNTYTKLTLGGTVGNPARLRIGGLVSNPTVFLSGNLDLPTSGTVTFDLSDAAFYLKGTYTLYEFPVGNGVTLNSGAVLNAVTSLNSYIAKSGTSYNASFSFSPATSTNLPCITVTLS